MRNSTGLIFSLLFGALSGCVSIPQFQITEQDKKVIPSQWSGSPALETSKAADLSEWWSTWSDPEIARLVAASQAANTDVRSAQENLRYAQASMTVANAGSRHWTVTTEPAAVILSAMVPIPFLSA